MICGYISVPNPVAPKIVPPVWYYLSITFSRIVTRFFSTFYNMSRRYLSIYHRFLEMCCLMSVNALARISKNAPTFGASTHSFVDRRAYSVRDMMYPDYTFNGWS